MQHLLVKHVAAQLAGLAPQRPVVGIPPLRQAACRLGHGPHPIAPGQTLEAACEARDDVAVAGIFALDQEGGAIVGIGEPGLDDELGQQFQPLAAGFGAHGANLRPGSYHLLEKGDAQRVADVLLGKAGSPAGGARAQPAGDAAGERGLLAGRDGVQD